MAGCFPGLRSRVAIRWATFVIAPGFDKPQWSLSHQQRVAHRLGKESKHLGGAVGRVGANDTAFSDRDAQYNASIFGAWTDADDDEPNISWVRTFGDEFL